MPVKARGSTGCGCDGGGPPFTLSPRSGEQRTQSAAVLFFARLTPRHSPWSTRPAGSVDLQTDASSEYARWCERVPEGRRDRFGRHRQRERFSPSQAELSWESVVPDPLGQIECRRTYWHRVQGTTGSPSSFSRSLSARDSPRVRKASRRHRQRPPFPLRRASPLQKVPPALNGRSQTDAWMGTLPSGVCSTSRPGTSSKLGRRLHPASTGQQRERIRAR